MEGGRLIPWPPSVLIYDLLTSTMGLKRLAVVLAMARIAQCYQGSDEWMLSDWIRSGRETRMQWSLRVFPAHLSDYQRLVTYIWATVGSAEIGKRSMPGQLGLLLQLRDHQGRVYFNRGAYSPKIGTNPEDLTDIKFVQPLCVLPGEYEIDAALYDFMSKEYNIKRTKLRVPKLHHDPLPLASRNLPDAEFSACSTTRSARLYLPVTPSKPTRIDIIANRRDPALGEPDVRHSLDVLSELQLSNGSLYVTVLDLENQKASTVGVSGAFNENDLWSKLPPLSPNKISARVLENQRNEVTFFLSEIRKRLQTPIPEANRVVIVISPPRKLMTPQDEPPIQIALPPNANIYYLRLNPPKFSFMPPPLSVPDPQDWSVPGQLPRGPLPVPPRAQPSDSLEETLRPLNPTLFDITTPLQFRQTLAALIREISR